MLFWSNKYFLAAFAFFATPQNPEILVRFPLCMHLPQLGSVSDFQARLSSGKELLLPPCHQQGPQNRVPGKKICLRYQHELHPSLKGFLWHQKSRKLTLKAIEGRYLNPSTLWLPATESKENLLSDRGEVAVLSPSDFGQKGKCSN